jgi:hypothetical protein
MMNNRFGRMAALLAAAPLTLLSGSADAQQDEFDNPTVTTVAALPRQ